MIDKLLTRVMPALLIAALLLVMIPSTSRPIMQVVAAWLYGAQERQEK